MVSYRVIDMDCLLPYMKWLFFKSDGEDIPWNTAGGLTRRSTWAGKWKSPAVMKGSLDIVFEGKVPSYDPNHFFEFRDVQRLEINIV